MRRLHREWNWYRQRSTLAELELLVMDVDGVLTDGGLWFDPAGQLIKRFDGQIHACAQSVKRQFVDTLFLSILQ